MYKNCPRKFFEIFGVFKLRKKTELLEVAIVTHKK